uniref:Uncharacterized protein n=1 Tax=Anguilla anguilla TaxID=7936 RepID=A0A0E9U7K3_ANGAN
MMLQLHANLKKCIPPYVAYAHRQN